LDLSLLPVEADFEQENGTRWGYSHSILQMDRDKAMFRRLQEVPTAPVPEDFCTFLCQDDQLGGEPHYGQTHEDPYGNKLRCAHAGLLAVHEDPARDSDRNRAVFAYLRALPQTTLVALYWH
jgi:hypothetical protein